MGQVRGLCLSHVVGARLPRAVPVQRMEYCWKPRACRQSGCFVQWRRLGEVARCCHAVPGILRYRPRGYCKLASGRYPACDRPRQETILIEDEAKGCQAQVNRTDIELTKSNSRNRNIVTSLARSRRCRPHEEQKSNTAYQSFHHIYSPAADASAASPALERGN